MKNRKRLDDAVAQNRLNLMLESQVAEIHADSIRIKTGAGEAELKNDAVIVCAGGELPTPFLKKIGVMVEARFGT
jgi:NADH dehydrogenase FAD-containing subunit